MKKPGTEPANTEEPGVCAKPALPLSCVASSPPVVWSIAGFDPSSGAGMTADLMTFAAHGLFGCSAITALTVQNTVGVFRWEPVGAALLGETLERLWEDLPPRGIKIGVLGTPELAAITARFLAEKRIRCGETFPSVVWDPVLRSSSERALYPETGLDHLRECLFPQVDWITPNWAELAMLSEMEVRDLASAESAARSLGGRYPGLHIVATGGDEAQPTDLLVLPRGECEAMAGEHIETSATHGTGCAFSSALLSGLVLGREPVEAVR